MKIREKTKILFTTVTELTDEELEEKISSCFTSLDDEQRFALKKDYRRMIVQSRKRFDI